MKVVILCGGQGTRLREETEYRPKPLVQVGGKPILWHIMKTYSHFGYSDFVLCLGYKGEMIKEYFLNYEAMNNDFSIRLGSSSEVRYFNPHKEQNFTVTLASTGLDAMTGARVKRVQPYVSDRTFMVTYGDGLIDVNISKLLKFHESHGKLATVTSVRPVSRFGILELQDCGTVQSFSEKPQVDGFVNAGYFVFDQRVFDYLKADSDCILEREPLEKLAADRQIVAYRHDGFFYAMDSYREFLHLNQLWDQGKAPWKVW